jgi:hypothetical protein
MLKIKFVKLSKSVKVTGWYNLINNIIYINNKLCLRKKISTLIHELIHYFIDKFNLDDSYHLLWDIIAIYYVTKSKPRRIRYIEDYINYYYPKCR